jgi:hypothetical protein
MQGEPLKWEGGHLMQSPDPAATTSIREAVVDMRETLFKIAEVAISLNISADSTDLHSFIQHANYNLGEAERELSVLSRGRY